MTIEFTFFRKNKRVVNGRTVVIMPTTGVCIYLDPSKCVISSHNNAILVCGMPLEEAGSPLPSKVRGGRGAGTN